MSLLNPFFLIGSLVLAVPLLVHLVRRERSEVVPFSSLMFLLKVPKRTVRQQMLKNLLLMALRLLLIALLVGIFARPYLVQSATPDGGLFGQGRGFVLLLDNSYSMRYDGNFDRLKAEANRRIDALSGNDRMALIAFNDSATVLSTPIADKGRLKAAISTLEPSFAGTKFFEAFALADRMMAEFGAQEKNLVLISDFQRSGWNRSSRESVIGHDVKTEMVSLGVAESANVGIDNVGVDPTSFDRVYAGRVVARVRNYGKGKPVTVPVALLINDKELARKTVTVPPGESVLAEFTGFELDLGSARGRVRLLSKDPLEVDNEFIFTIDRRERLNVLILDAGTRNQSLLLKTVFTASDDVPFNVKVLAAQAATPDQLSREDVLIVNDVPRLSEALRARMVESRKAGQGQFVILAENADLKWWSSLEGFPVKATQKIHASRDRNKPAVLLTSYDKNHPIFKTFQGSARFTLNSAQFFQYVELELQPGAVAVAKFENGVPALAESAPEARGLMVFGSTVDKSWNDLPLRPAFPLIIPEIARYLSRYDATRGWYTLGEGIPVVGSLEAGVARVVTPEGEQQSLGELKTGEQRFFAPDEPGFHELRVGRSVRVLAVNPPASEGNLEPMIPEDLLASVQSTESEARQAGTFAQDDALEYARRQMGWWYLLLIALVAAVVEIYIANSRSQKGRVGVAVQ
jgi:hypothetical protein